MELATIEDELLIVRLCFIDENLEHSDAVSLVARHGVEDVGLAAFFVRDNEELFEVKDARIVLLLVDLFHV